MPLEPSTRIIWPVLIVDVAKPVPVTAGSPYSRQTMAAWLIMPPMSVTHARILGNTGAQLGAVMDLNQGLLNALGVSSPELERVLAVARGAGALGAKLSGAGGGGAILALASGNEAELVEALRAAGCPAFISTFSGNASGQSVAI